ncbi:hypothetical protein QP400_06465 [Winkia sp. UMB3158]|jgi:hypothetical protein|uniref:Uncharacterized protein n=1 Tax=Winkia neuii subsp. anitrata TaxID=29318 RepID=A0AB38XPR2_9ACTO|nr:MULTISPECIES: hypothetical protein [Terrabacteria group]MDK8340966.1 hypothetical protein [Winkia sp. UMB3164B]OFK03355.1 hypothetical protein HMPREF2835_04965 [Actinomyces sp. HMSC072A03]OFT54405.1 hypothetical protein HMPREF3152_07950 [Actinomyces sp. HMSC06A08]KWZ75471.1 hypothetical protein HMPREF3198_00082 [Winkia neuii]MDK6230767.1 hypothetical protein [Streptococcus agalactiae]
MKPVDVGIMLVEWETAVSNLHLCRDRLDKYMGGLTHAQRKQLEDLALDAEISAHHIEKVKDRIQETIKKQQQANVG